VGNAGSGSVTGLDATSHAVVATFPVGSDARSLVGAGGFVYVSRSLSNVVTVLSEATNRVVATVSVGPEPAGLAYDNVTNQVWVANEGGMSVSVIAATNNTVVKTVSVGLGPVALAYDYVTRHMFVSNYLGSTLSVVSDVTYLPLGQTAPDVIYPAGLAVDSARHNVWVAVEGSSAVRIYSTFGPGLGGWIRLGEVHVGAYPTGVAYDPASDVMFVTNSQSGNVTLVSAGTHTPVSWVPTTSTGNIPTGVAVVSLDHVAFVVNEALDSVSPITTAGALGASIGLVPYLITFRQQGLPPSTSWTVQFGWAANTTSQASMTFPMPNGSYAFTIPPLPHYKADPSSGTLKVSGKAALYCPSFVRTYSVEFDENGLPAGAIWSVALESLTNTSPSSTIVFTEWNGTYAFTVGTVQGYTPQPNGGSIVVQGNDVVRSINFSQTAAGAPGILGAPGPSGYYLLGGGIAAAAAVVAVLVLLRLRGRSHPAAA
jgi:YVTN family beta-propeller protein